MSVKYSELPVTTNPAAANRVAVLDTADGTLKTTTLENAVKGAGVQSGFSGTTAEVAAAIQAGVIKEGMTVNITDDYEAGASGESGTKLTQAEFDALPAAQQNVGKYWITDGSSALTVDTELSTTSHNPVENGVITTEINKINTHLTNLTNWSRVELGGVSGSGSITISGNITDYDIAVLELGTPDHKGVNTTTVFFPKLESGRSYGASIWSTSFTTVISAGFVPSTGVLTCSHASFGANLVGIKITS